MNVEFCSPYQLNILSRVILPRKVLVEDSKTFKTCLMDTRWTSLATANLQHDVCDPIVFLVQPLHIMRWIKLLVIFKILENVNRFIQLEQ